MTKRKYDIISMFSFVYENKKSALLLYSDCLYLKRVFVIVFYTSFVLMYVFIEARMRGSLGCSFN